MKKDASLKIKLPNTPGDTSPGIVYGARSRPVANPLGIGSGAILGVEQYAEGFPLVNVRRHWLTLSAAVVLMVPLLGWGLMQLPQAKLSPGWLELPVGSSAAMLGKRLRDEHGMTLPVWAFRLLARVNGSAARLRPGTLSQCTALLASMAALRSLLFRQAKALGFIRCVHPQVWVVGRHRL